MGLKSFTSIGSQGFITASSPVKLKIQTFLSSGTLKLATKTIVNYVIIGGGGGSGDPNDYGYGGGGGGGYKIGTMTLDVGLYPVVVGDGGLGGINLNITPAQKQGKNSSFNGIIALGGGAGAGGAGSANSPGTGSVEGASSGGGGSSYVNGTGYAGTDGQGFAGGNGARGELNHGNGGGGGGATQKGEDSVITTSTTSFAGSYAGKGGAGIKVDSTNLAGYNTTSYFSGGGGGSTTDGINGVGGLGGGGNGSNSSATPGTPNTGGGAGAPSQNGGSGIVILTFIPFYPIARYWKFSIDNVRDNPNSNGAYLNEISLYKDNVQVSNTGVIASFTLGRLNGSVDWLFDNDLKNGFYGTARQNDILFTFPNNITMNQYRIATSPMTTTNDPISWRLSYSFDNVNFISVDTVVNYPITTDRSVYIPMITLSGALLPQYSFRVKGLSLTVPTTDIGGFPLTNTNGVIMVNDSVRGFVFSFSGANYLSLNPNQTLITQTRTFWLSSATANSGNGCVYCSNKFLLYFLGGTLLKCYPNEELREFFTQ
jgi:hypothetical protein